MNLFYILSDISPCAFFIQLQGEYCLQSANAGVELVVILHPLSVHFLFVSHSEVEL